MSAPNVLHYDDNGVLRDELEAVVTCSWFALCLNDATDIEQHPVLGGVPICSGCAAKVAACS